VYIDNQPSMNIFLKKLYLKINEKMQTNNNNIKKRNKDESEMA
jgi:hypothetical protein